MIHLERFAWRYADSAVWALRDVNLAIDTGQFVAIAGASGSGKSTLAQAMAGLLVGRRAGQHEGSIDVAGKDVSAAPLHAVAERIALVQQNPETHFATLTVRDELAFALENRCAARDVIERRSRQAGELLGISHLADRELASLSGGEKQRVAVASIVASDPAVIVLDEPSASLDPEASAELFRLLAGLCRDTGLTVAIIEHKLAQLLPLGPRLIRLNAGRIVEDRLRAGPLELRQTVPSAMGRSAQKHFQEAAQQAVSIARTSHLNVDLGGMTILRDVSLRLDAGQCAALVGPNGGGKTTLLHALVGLLSPSKGSIQVGDTLVGPSTVAHLARDVGFVFQNADHQLVADSVREEAIFAARRLGILDPALEEEALALLDRARLANRLDDHPFALSWGEKRRLNLISAVLHRPKLLLLDEPFAGQDNDNITFLLDVIDDLVQNQGAACLLVIHDAHVVARLCNRVLFMVDGRIEVDAPTADAFGRLRARGYDAYAPACPDATSSGTFSRRAAVAATARMIAAESPQRRRGTALSYQSGHSIVHRFHPVTKVAWLAWISLAVFLVDSPALLIALANALVALLWLARVPPYRIPYIRQWLILGVAVLVLQSVFIRDGAPLFAFVTSAGIEAGIRTACRLLAIVLASSLFVITTDPVALVAGLMHVGLPYRWGFALVTTLRLTSIYRIEAHHVYRAQSIRGVGYDAIGPRRWWLLLRNLSVPLIVGALRTAHSLSLSMEGRAFGVHPSRTFCRTVVWAGMDWIAVMFLLTTIIAAVLQL